MKKLTLFFCLLFVGVVNSSPPTSVKNCPKNWNECRAIFKDSLICQGFEPKDDLVVIEVTLENMFPPNVDGIKCKFKNEQFKDFYVLGNNCKIVDAGNYQFECDKYCIPSSLSDCLSDDDKI